LFHTGLGGLCYEDPDRYSAGEPCPGLALATGSHSAAWRVPAVIANPKPSGATGAWVAPLAIV
jgi:hypothetical protein